MRVSPETPISVVMTTLQKEIDERKSMLAMLQALVASGASPSAPFTNGGVGAPIITSGIRKRGSKRVGGVGAAAVQVVRAAGRPLHGLREIIPALEAQGYKIKHRAGLATTLLRTGALERVAPGTFGLKGGGANSAN
jgi:hypothetical protein